MNSSSSNADTIQPSEYWRDQCVLYLMGELQADQSAEFEQQLERSKELSEYLGEQASVITLLTARPKTSRNLVRQTAKPRNLTVLAAAVAAIAASFLAVVAWNSLETSEEKSKIALAWADLQLASVDRSSIVIDDQWPDDPSTALTAQYSDSSFDETVDWMSTALAIEAVASLEETNDG